MQDGIFGAKEWPNQRQSQANVNVSKSEAIHSNWNWNWNWVAKKGAGVRDGVVCGGNFGFQISFHAIIEWQSVNALACKFSFDTRNRNAATDFDRLRLSAEAFIENHKSKRHPPTE